MITSNNQKVAYLFTGEKILTSSPDRAAHILTVEGEVRPPCTGLTWHSSLGRGTAGPPPGHTGTGGSSSGRHSCPPGSASLPPGWWRRPPSCTPASARSLRPCGSPRASDSPPRPPDSVCLWATTGGTCGCRGGSWTGRVWSSHICGSQFSHSWPGRLRVPSLTGGLWRRGGGRTCWARCRGPGGWGRRWSRGGPGGRRVRGSCCAESRPVVTGGGETGSFITSLSTTRTLH